MQTRPIALGALAVVAAAALTAFWLWPESPIDTPAPVVEAPAAAPSAAEPASVPVLAAAASAPASAVEPLAADDGAVRDALITLLGRTAVLQQVQTDGFAARVVATVDNLTRGHAAPRLWPVHPAEGRFTVDDQQRIAAANAARYAPLVGLVKATPPAAAAALYWRLLPQLQAAYEELGLPGRSFHDRLGVVIDELLDTPQPSGRPQVTLTEVKGPIAPERPWVRYEYANPAYESRSAGQRILLRLGQADRAAVLDWLRQFREQIRR